jgi:hypothetical protein
MKSGLMFSGFVLALWWAGVNIPGFHEVAGAVFAVLCICLVVGMALISGDEPPIAPDKWEV